MEPAMPEIVGLYTILWTHFIRRLEIGRNRLIPRVAAFFKLSENAFQMRLSTMQQNRKLFIPLLRTIYGIGSHMQPLIACWNSNLRYHFDRAEQKNHIVHQNTVEKTPFSIKIGERVGIVGGNASGKSAMLDYFLKSLKTSKISSRARDKITYCSEDPRLFSGSVCHNIDPTWSISGDIINSSFQAVKNPTVPTNPWSFHQRETYQSENPNSSPLLHIYLDTILNIGNAQLTLAQCQLIAFARTIAQHRSNALKESEQQVIFLDDPTSSLDATTNAAIQSVIRREFQSCTIMMASSNLANIIDFDRIIVMNEGEVVEIGSPVELLQNHNVRGFAKMFEDATNAGLHLKPTGYNWDGLDRDGFDEWGFDQAGFNIDGLDRYGFNRSGFAANGLDIQGRTPEMAREELSWTDQCNKALVMDQRRKRTVAQEVHQRMEQLLGSEYDQGMPSGMMIYVETKRAKIRKHIEQEQSAMTLRMAGRARVREFAAPGAELE